MTADYLRVRLHYDPETGIFIWKPREPGDKRWNTRYAGQVAGSMDSHGYRQIMIDGKLYKAARLAWLYIHGESPENQIDHINRVRDDNRLANLKDVTSSENNNNKSTNNGLPQGVQWHTERAKYQAWIPRGVPVFGRTYLGQYGDPIVAGEVVQEGIGIILDNEDDENIKKLLKGLKDSRTEVLSEEQKDASYASRKTSGLPKGVYKNGGSFQARIWRNGKYVHLGTFNTPEEASAVYNRSNV